MMPFYEFACETCNRNVLNEAHMDAEDKSPQVSCVCGARRWRRVFTAPASQTTDWELKDPKRDAMYLHHKRFEENRIRKAIKEGAEVQMKHAGPQKYRPEV